MNFPTCREPAIHAGFDVHGSLIAAATEDRQVKLFDARTAQEVPIGQERGGLGDLGDLARCLCFTDHSTSVNKRRALRLMVATGSVVEEWAW